MVKIAPFQGIRYNPKKIKDMDSVMSPPYDIISPETQNSLYEKHPYNSVRLILNKKKPDDTTQENRYTRAAEHLKQWLEKQVLIQEDNEAIYPYKVTYTVKGKQKQMSGFFVLLRLDPEYEKVKAHERTLSKPKEDRLKLMRACNANLEPIELLYIDEEDQIRKAIDGEIDNPLIDVEGYDGFQHTLWKIDDKDLISQIKKKLQNEVLFIADGHHRYQTALNYAEEQKKKTGNKDGDAPFNYRMVILANMFDEGLSVLPTHRLVNLPANIDVNEFIEKIQEYFTVEQKPVESLPDDPTERGREIMKAVRSGGKHTFAMYFGDTYYMFKLEKKDVMNELASDRSETWRMLDVSVLHKIVIEQLLGITEETLEDHVKYTRDDGEAVKFVDDDTFDLSFLMNATKIDELRDVADEGEHMPQKSTYFLPKMLSGLVMRQIE